MQGQRCTGKSPSYWLFWLTCTRKWQTRSGFLSSMYLNENFNVPVHWRNRIVSAIQHDSKSEASERCCAHHPKAPQSAGPGASRSS